MGDCTPGLVLHKPDGGGTHALGPTACGTPRRDPSFHIYAPLRRSSKAEYPPNSLRNGIGSARVAKTGGGRLASQAPVWHRLDGGHAVVLSRKRFHWATVSLNPTLTLTPTPNPQPTPIYTPNPNQD